MAMTREEEIKYFMSIPDEPSIINDGKVSEFSGFVEICKNNAKTKSTISSILGKPLTSVIRNSAIEMPK